MKKIKLWEVKMNESVNCELDALKILYPNLREDLWKSLERALRLCWLNGNFLKNKA